VRCRGCFFCLAIVITRNFPAIHHIEGFAFHESVVELRDEDLDMSLTIWTSTSTVFLLPFGALVTMEEMSTCYNDLFSVH
jgi:hypothetical protein